MLPPRSLLLGAGLLLCLLAVPLALYGVVNDGVSLKYTPEMGDWEGRIRLWKVVLVLAFVGVWVFSMALLRRSRRRGASTSRQNGQPFCDQSTSV